MEKNNAGGFLKKKTIKFLEIFVTIVILSTLVFSSLNFNGINLAQAATGNFAQTTWTSASATTALLPQTGWANYLSKDSGLTAGSNLQLSLVSSSTTQTSDADFNSGTNASTTVSGNSVSLATTAPSVYYSSGAFTSSIIDTGQLNASSTLNWNATLSSISSSTTFSSAGSQSWTAPAGVTSVDVELWGGGGGTGPGSSGGGGGGAYSKETISVTPGNNYTVFVGAGGSYEGTSGGDSYFINNSTVLAKGGSPNGSQGGQASAGVGTIKYSGGNGAGGSGCGAGGGGGGGAGNAGNGGNGSGSTGGTGGVSGGGSGGNGGTGYGSAPGGGGGGGFNYCDAEGSWDWGGNGAPGKAILNYTIESTTTAITMQVRGATSSDAVTSQSWCAITSGQNIYTTCATGAVAANSRYFQYKADLVTTNSAQTPSLNDVTLAYSYYPTANQTLTSSYINSGNSNNYISGLSWTEDTSLPTGAAVTVSLRTGAATSTLGSWVDFTNASSTCSKVSGTVTCGATLSSFPAGLKDASNDQWVQYKITLGSTGLNTSTVSDITINFTTYNEPSSLAQYKSDGLTTLVTDGYSTSTSVVLSANVGTLASDASTAYAQFEFTTGSFTGTPNATGATVATSQASVATITVANGSSYKWRARLVDSIGRISGWTSFDSGTNSFTVDSSVSAPASVTVSSYASSTTQLSASWASVSDSGSGLSKYQYAIGTTAGGTQVVDWTDNSTTASVTKTGLTLSEGSTYYFTVRAVDNAGNIGSATNSSGIVVDVSAPSSNSISINAGGTYAASSTTLTLASTDSNSGLYQMRFSNDNATWSNWESYSTTKSNWSVVSGYGATAGDGEKTVYAQFKDNAGNASSAVSDTAILDSTAPTGSISINSAATHSSSTSVTLTLSAADTLAGVYQMRFSNDNLSYSNLEVYGVSKAWTVASGDGAKTVYVKFTDNAGNISPVYNDSIILDGTGPTGSISINGGSAYTTSTTVTLALSATDSGVGTVSQMQFSNDGASYSALESYGISKAWTVTAGDGVKTVYVKFTDSLGNISTVYTDTITLDNNAPASGSISINAGATYASSTSVVLTLSATDTGSGLASSSLSNDGVDYASQAYNTSTAWTLSAGDGVKTVYVKFIDNAGKISDAISDTVTLDTANPSGGSVGYDDGYRTSNSVTVTVEPGTDSGSGINIFSLQRNQATVTNGTVGNFGAFATITTFNATSTYVYEDTAVVSDYAYQYKVVALDNAGNQNSYTNVNVAKIDSAGPTGGSITYSTDVIADEQSMSIAITMTNGSDAVSGVASRTLQKASSHYTAGNPDGWSEYSDLATSTAPYTDTSLVNKYGYKYRLKQVDGAGNISYATCNNGQGGECIAIVSFNIAPEAQIASASENSSGAVSVSYQIRDTDTEDGNANISLQYYNGTSWVAASSTTGNTGALTTNTASTTAWTSYSLAWNAKTDYPDQYAAAQQIRIKIDDLQAARNLGYATTILTFDTKNPAISSIIGNASAGTLMISTTDDSTLQYMMLSNDSGYSGALWQDYDASVSGWAFATSTSVNPTVYVKAKDNYGNIGQSTVILPRSPASIDLKDTSNVGSTDYREVFSWNDFSQGTGSAFSKYQIYRSADGGEFALATEVVVSSTTYYWDTSVSAGTSYGYKLRIFDAAGNNSDWSGALTDTPNGVSENINVAPTLSVSPAVTAYADRATVTWTTNIASDSRVGYSTSTGVFTSTASSSALAVNHSVALSNLTASTTYYYNISSYTSFGDSLTSDNGGTGYTFTTGAAPVISNVSSASTTETGTIISWNTDVNSDSWVIYLDPENNEKQMGIDALVGGDSAPYAHTVNLGGLTPGTAYRYKVQSTDANSNTGTDDNGGQYYAFETSIDTIAPVISEISTPVVTSDTIVFYWKTDEVATGYVEYGISADSYSSSTVASLVTTKNHIQTATPLAAGTSYYYRIAATDSNGNLGYSAQQTATTTSSSNVNVSQFVQQNIAAVSLELYNQALAARGSGGGGSASVASETKDTNAPIITNIQATSTSAFGATITFDTSEDAAVSIAYGKDTAYGLSAGDVVYKSKHSYKLEGLKMGTQYHFKIKAADKSGNTAISEDNTFTTKYFTESIDSMKTLENASQFQEEVENSIESILPSLLPPFLEKPQVTDVTESSATISWKTNVRSYAVVSYIDEANFDPKKENPYSSETSNTLNKELSHEILLIGLKPNTLYHFAAKSFSVPQVAGVSGDMTFITKAAKVQAKIFDIKTDSFRAVWTTEEPASSIVEYRNMGTGEINRKIDENKKSSHDVTISNLTPGVSYQVRVFGYNEKGNLIEAGDPSTVRTSVDVTPPVITGFKIDSALVPGKNDRLQSIVSWQTDKPSNSTVYFSEGVGLPGTAELTNKVEVVDSFVQNHAVIVTTFKPGTIYQIKIVSTDLSGNTASFGPRTIITPKQAESIFNVIFKNFEDTFKFLKNAGQ